MAAFVPLDPIFFLSAPIAHPSWGHSSLTMSPVAAARWSGRGQSLPSRYCCTIELIPVSFGGLLTTEFLEPHPGRGFCFRQTYRSTVDVPADDHVKKFLNSALKPQGPPSHMHQYQAEYFKVEQGIMGVNIDGVQHKKTPEDPEFSVPAGTFHGFFRHPESPGPMTVVLSATDSGNDYKLDRVFFENWYGYWHDALLYEGGMNTIQWLAVSASPSARIHASLTLRLRYTTPEMLTQMCRPGYRVAEPSHTGPASSLEDGWVGYWATSRFIKNIPPTGTTQSQK